MAPIGTIHMINTPCQHTLSTHPVNIPYQLTVTYPIIKPCQLLLSTRPINTPWYYALAPTTLSTYPINIAIVHLIYPPYEYTLSKHPTPS